MRLQTAVRFENYGGERIKFVWRNKRDLGEAWSGGRPKRIARTKAERLALMKAIAAEMRADGRLPPLDLVDAFGAR